MSPVAGAVGSIIGFSVGMAIHDRFYPSGAPHHLQILAVIVPWSIIVGAFIGFALGYLESRRERRHTDLKSR
jgi:NhaP-type Na+/H+ or K+/H+ antiporter